METPNYVAWRFWIDMLVLVGVIANTAYTWWSTREKVNSKRFLRLENDVKERVTSAAIDAIEKEREVSCERHRGRTSSIEGEIKKLATEVQHLPGQADIARVHARMDSVSKEMDQAVGELRATRRQLDLVLEQLLRGSK